MSSPGIAATGPTRAGDPLDHSGEGRLLERQGQMTALPGYRGQLDFLQHVQRIFDEGEFVATYKFALLISLVELAIERGDDTGAPLELDLHSIAERFIEQYWPASPYGAADGAPDAHLLPDLRHPALGLDARRVLRDCVAVRGDRLTDLPGSGRSKWLLRSGQSSALILQPHPPRHPRRREPVDPTRRRFPLRIGPCKHTRRTLDIVCL
jgi:hypothetical protein